MRQLISSSSIPINGNMKNKSTQLFFAATLLSKRRMYMGYLSEDAQPFYAMLRQVMRQGGIDNQYELAACIGMEKSKLCRALRNDRGCKLGNLDKPTDLLRLTMALVLGKTHRGMSTDDELDKFISLIPRHLASPKGKTWIKQEIAKLRIPWNIQEVTTDAQVPAVNVVSRIMRDSYPKEVQDLESFIDEFVEKLDRAHKEMREQILQLRSKGDENDG